MAQASFDNKDILFCILFPDTHKIGRILITHRPIPYVAVSICITEMYYCILLYFETYIKINLHIFQHVYV